MAEEKQCVIVRRWPDEYTLIGPPVIVLDLDDAAGKLAQSGFMVPWLKQKVREALVEGILFQNTKRMDQGWKGRADGIVSEYKLATQEEVLNAYDVLSQSAYVSAKANTKRAQEKHYQVCYDASAGSSYHGLPRQARTIMDILNDAKVNPLSEAAIEHLLVARAEELRTRQEPMKIFGFYRRPFIDGGHLKEV